MWEGIGEIQESFKLSLCYCSNLRSFASVELNITSTVSQNWCGTNEYVTGRRRSRLDKFYIRVCS